MVGYRILEFQAGELGVGYGAASGAGKDGEGLVDRQVLPPIDVAGRLVRTLVDEERAAELDAAEGDAGIEQPLHRPRPRHHHDDPVDQSAAIEVVDPLDQLVAIAVGVRAAKERGGRFDVASSVIMLGLWSVPTMLAGVELPFKTEYFPPVLDIDLSDPLPKLLELPHLFCRGHNLLIWLLIIIVYSFTVIP